MYPKMSSFGTRSWVLAVLMMVLTAWLAGSAPALADKTAKCGGDGEKPCPIGVKANYIAKAQTKCPKGSFFDVASFSCWSCPSGFTKTGAPANTGEACLRKPSTEYAEAEKDKKIKFSKKTLKQIKKGKFDKICKGNSYYDKKGGKYGACWECPKGFVRNITKSAKGDKACVKVTGLSRKKADKVGGFNPCRKGFFDPRAGGQCWSCPGGYFRGPTKVTSKDACLIKPASVCDPGNILIHSKCLKKGECGKFGQRPCLVVERVPSCNKGLFEDFTQNKCLNPAAVVCSAMMKTLRGLEKGSKKASKAEEKVEKEMIKASKSALKTILGNKTYNKIVGGMQQGQKLISDARKKADRQIDKIVAKPMKVIAPAVDQITTYAEMLSKNKDKLTKLVTSKQFCLQKPKDKVASLKNALGIELKPLNKASLAPKWYDNLLINSANAANDPKKYSYALGISASVTDVPEVFKVLFLDKVAGKLPGGYGLSFTYYMVFNDKQVGQRMGIGLVATSAPGYSISPIFQLLEADRIQDVGGDGFSFGISGDAQFLIEKLEHTINRNASKDGTKGIVEVGVAFLVPSNFSRFDGVEFSLLARAKSNQHFDAGQDTKFSVAADIGWGWDFALR